MTPEQFNARCRDAPNDELLIFTDGSVQEINTPHHQKKKVILGGCIAVHRKKIIFCSAKILGLSPSPYEGEFEAMLE